MSKKSEIRAKALSKKAQDKQKIILEMLKSHGAKIYNDLDKGEFPKFSIPSRSVTPFPYCHGHACAHWFQIDIGDTLLPEPLLAALLIQAACC